MAGLELFNQPEDLIVDNDRFALSQPNIEGGKNIKWADLQSLIRGITAVRDSSLFVTGSTATLDKANFDFYILDLTTGTSDVTLTLSNFERGDTMLIHVTQGIVSRDLIFPTGTKIVAGVGSTVLGIASAAPQVIPLYFDGNDFIIQGTGEAQ